MPWIPGDVPAGEKRGKYWQESDAFRWPADRERIVDHMEKHIDDDLFWTPVLYDGDRRVKELLAENRCLYADLDEADPRGFEKDHDLKPTIAWETSPGRYQALWVIDGDIVGAADEGAENHRLTYLLGADHSGWDGTQVLRIPLWHNHKAEYRELYGEDGAPGRILWSTGPVYDVSAFDDLPEVLTAQDVEDVLDADISAVNRREVLARVREKLSKRIRDLLWVDDPGPADRSEVLWDIERSLADVGCTAAEIVAIVRKTVWNKYEGRGDEMIRLKTEAAKAVAERPEEVKESLEAERDMPVPMQIFLAIRDLPTPEWLVEDIWQVGSRGFIAGEPKSYKTWIAMDLALSVASGLDFLGEFKVRTKGRVLFIQEEDSLPMISERLEFYAAKDPRFHPKGVLVRKAGGGGDWLPPMEELPLDILCLTGLNLSSGEHRVWLKDLIMEFGYILVVMDPFNYIAGDAEIERPEVSRGILRPLIDVMGDCALAIVHHMKKSGDRNTRGGARMLGSTALHGWTREALYITPERDSTLRVDRESKSAQFMRFKMKPHLGQRLWSPEIIREEGAHEENVSDSTADSKGTQREGKVETFLKLNEGEEFSQAELAKLCDLSPSGVHRQVKRLLDEGKITKVESGKYTWASSQA